MTLLLTKKKILHNQTFLWPYRVLFFPVRMTSTHLNKLCRLTDSLVIVRNS